MPPAPLDVELDLRTMVEPDALAARRDAFNDRRLPSAPLLAVEVADIGPGETWAASQPFEMTIDPGMLLD